LISREFAACCRGSPGLSRAEQGLKQGFWRLVRYKASKLSRVKTGKKTGQKEAYAGTPGWTSKLTG
tara:strand:+ start:329 stop:526 length:198 start_codon:yes stop_codon:yes gene_type:complete